MVKSLAEKERKDLTGHLTIEHILYVMYSINFRVLHNLLPLLLEWLLQLRGWVLSCKIEVYNDEAKFPKHINQEINFVMHFAHVWLLET